MEKLIEMKWGKKSEKNESKVKERLGINGIRIEMVMIDIGESKRKKIEEEIKKKVSGEELKKMDEKKEERKLLKNKKKLMLKRKKED